ncbi:MAG TPA: class I SAM-dependent methyltransferase [Candidatus Hydrogenedentes bacterium]|nr:class I SAM-dependent methyltransferase [Candidatus Hydrogenedentota bacterium]
MTVALALVGLWAAIGYTAPLRYPNLDEFTKEDAEKMEGAAAGSLAPVYGPLAEHLVDTFDLADKAGIGIDLGSGPGTLIVELCKRTKMHWVNADINPYFFPNFLKRAEEAEFAGRVSAVFADAQALPFKDAYADVIVSRGSFWIWEDQRAAFSEIYRVLRPGGVAYVGRGFSENLPVEVARATREGSGQGKGGPPKYDLDETEAQLRAVMNSLLIKTYTIHRPAPPGSEGVNYGIWLEIRK